MNVGIKILSFVTISAMVISWLVSPVAVQAATDTLNQSNQNTGNNSTNRNRARIRRDGQQIVRKNAMANTVASVNTNTGVNQSNGNTLGGGVLSGDVATGANLNNALNQQAGGECPVLPASTTVINNGNMNTGSDSTNANQTTIRENGLCDVRNDATANTTLVVNNNTGNNESNGNTGGGGVTSGNVNATLNINNALN